MNLSARLLLLIIIFIGISKGDDVFPDITGSKELITTGGKISWSIFLGNDTIVITVTIPVRAWIAVGWGRVMNGDVSMEGADMIIACDDFNDNVTDFQWPTSTKIIPSNMPSMDPPEYQNVLWYTFTQSSSETSMTFARLVLTNDTLYDNGILGEQLLIWAHGDPSHKDYNSLAYHGAGNMGSSLINFYGEGLVLKIDSLKYWHGALMVISYLFCMSFGVFVARYLKDFYWWFPLHIFVQVLGVIGCIVAFIIALLMTKGNHFDNIHSWFGLVTLSLSVLAPSLGWAADLTFNPSRNYTPAWPDKFHWWVSRTTVLLSYATIFLGLREFQAPIPLEACLWITVGIYLSIYFCVDFYRWSNRHSHKHDSTLITYPEPNHKD